MRTLIVSLLLAPRCCRAEPPQLRPFSILRPNAAPITLASYRQGGRAVFISTSCPHCQEFTKALVPIANEYSPRGVQFLECAVNADALEAVPGFIRQFQPPFPVGYNTQTEVDDYCSVPSCSRSTSRTWYS